MFSWIRRLVIEVFQDHWKTALEWALFIALVVTTFFVGYDLGKKAITCDGGSHVSNPWGD